jgi:hypothetical protein
MKKSIIVLALLTFFFSAAIQAQNSDSRENFTIGVKAGLNISNVWDSEGEDFEHDAKAGFAGGLFMGIPLGSFFGFQPEVLLSQKGFVASGTLLGTPYSFTKTTTYIDVPLQLQIKPIEYVTLVVGPQYSYLINEKNVYTFGENSIEQEEEFENDNIRKNILGFVVGADANISHFVISGRVGWDLLNNNGDGTSTTPRYKNQWIQLTVGFKL